MRTASIIFLTGLVAAAAGCGGNASSTSPGAVSADDTEAFQGAWKFTKAELPEGMHAPGRMDLDKTWVVVEGKVIKFSEDGQPTRYLTFTTDATKMPKRVTFTPSDETGKPVRARPAEPKGPPVDLSFTCIYAIDGNTLTVAVPSYAGGQLPTQFKAAPARRKFEDPEAAPDEKTAFGVLYLTRAPAGPPPATAPTGTSGTKK